MHNVREHKQVGDRQDWLQERLKDIIVPSTKPQHGQSQNINNVFPNDVLGSNSWKSWMSALLYETSEDPTVKLIFLAVLLPYVCMSFSLLIYFVYLFIEAFTYSFVLFYFHLIYFFFVTFMFQNLNYPSFNQFVYILWQCLTIGLKSRSQAIIWKKN